MTTPLRPTREAAIALAAKAQTLDEIHAALRMAREAAHADFQPIANYIEVLEARLAEAERWLLKVAPLLHPADEQAIRAFLDAAGEGER